MRRIEIGVNRERTQLLANIHITDDADDGEVSASQRDYVFVPPPMDQQIIEAEAKQLRDTVSRMPTHFIPISHGEAQQFTILGPTREYLQVHMGALFFGALITLRTKAGVNTDWVCNFVANANDLKVTPICPAVADN